MKTAIVGGGAAGFFLALNLKEMAPEMEITIFEKSQRVLAKVEISGGGRCNCTNSFEQVKDLQAVYPRGHRLLKRLFKVFGPQDAYKWFEHRGVRLVTQEDQCVFPASQDSHTIIDC
ncbi:MAG: NAD(P)/FAD-dependent oxidoreductase, partial [Prevotella sp.]|nr:NAD(P)/FAD-dependent oxidoreductase [Prevotella sp.]